MNEHDRLREMLARRSELTPGEETQLQEHLAGCDECRSLHTVYARQAALLRSLPAVSAPPALRAGVLAAIERKKRPRRWVLPRYLIPVPAAAFVLVAAVLAYENRPQGAPSHTALTRITAPVLTQPATTGVRRGKPTAVPKPRRTPVTRRHHHSTPLPSTPQGAPPVVAVGPSPAGTQASQSGPVQPPTTSATSLPALGTPVVIAVRSPVTTSRRQPPPTAPAVSTPVHAASTRPPTATAVPTAAQLGSPTPVSASGPPPTGTPTPSAPQPPAPGPSPSPTPSPTSTP
ncbi:MAG TPA: zf-HC2 domain-containing protein [Chloroflexota bacterium]|nr:zf-HC2 domain-containing protein [Chloroflexota bacterium]